MLIVVCGVSGCGKTSVATELSKVMRIELADADDYHSEENKALMRRGIGLTDANRLSWLVALRTLLLDWSGRGVSGVLACSALKPKYRHLLNSGLSYDANDNDVQLEPRDDLGLVFVLLSVERALIETRLRARHHDIVRDVALLDSQFRTLEMPSPQTAALLNSWDDGSCLYRDTSPSNQTSYLIFVLACPAHKTALDFANRVDSFLSSETLRK